MNFTIEELTKWQQIFYDYWVRDLPSEWHYTAEDWIYAICTSDDLIYVGVSNGKLYILNRDGKLQKTITC